MTNKLVFHQNLDQFTTVIEKSGNLPELINQLEKENRKNVTDSFFNIISLFIQSSTLSSQFSHSLNEVKSNGFFLISEFPNKFITKLENEIYPAWYSASFLSDNTNSAIWGHYGDNHKGVCLKYKTYLKEDELILNLRTEYGYSSGPIVGMRPHYFKKIQYHNQHTEIDFFRSMGRLRKFELNKLWYSDENGNLSVCGSHLDSKEKQDKWRKKYWDNYNDSLAIKLKEWEYENEYRLVVHGDFIDYSSKNSRKLQYDFKDLESITFGIKTDNSSKLRIMKIIEQKCLENNRTDFEFYQAYYSKSTGKIESFKLNLL